MSRSDMSFSWLSNEQKKTLTRLAVGNLEEEGGGGAEERRNDENRLLRLAGRREESNHGSAVNGWNQEEDDDENERDVEEEKQLELLLHKLATFSNTSDHLVPPETTTSRNTESTYVRAESYSSPPASRVRTGVRSGSGVGSDSFCSKVDAESVSDLVSKALRRAAEDEGGDNDAEFGRTRNFDNQEEYEGFSSTWKSEANTFDRARVGKFVHEHQDEAKEVNEEDWDAALHHDHKQFAKYLQRTSARESDPRGRDERAATRLDSKDATTTTVRSTVASTSKVSVASSPRDDNDASDSSTLRLVDAKLRNEAEMAILRRLAREEAPLVDLNAPDPLNSFEWFSMAEKRHRSTRLIDFMKRYRRPSRRFAKKMSDDRAARSSRGTSRDDGLHAIVLTSKQRRARPSADVSPRARMFRLETEMRAKGQAMRVVVPRRVSPSKKSHAASENGSELSKRVHDDEIGTNTNGVAENDDLRSQSIEGNAGTSLLPPGNLASTSKSEARNVSTRVTLSEPPGALNRLSVASSTTKRYIGENMADEGRPVSLRNGAIRNSQFTPQRLAARGSSVVDPSARSVASCPPGNFARDPSSSKRILSTSDDGEVPGMGLSSPSPPLPSESHSLAIPPGNLIREKDASSSRAPPPGALSRMSVTTRNYMKGYFATSPSSSSPPVTTDDDDDDGRTSSSSVSKAPAGLRESLFSPASFDDFEKDLM